MDFPRRWLIRSLSANPKMAKPRPGPASKRNILFQHRGNTVTAAHHMGN